jgi:hypothetical protein
VPTTLPPASPPRTRTPSDLKWLLAERATLHGQAQHAAQRLEDLELHAETLRDRLSQTLETISLLSEHAKSVAARLAAFDTTIGTLHPGVAPDAAGSMRPWAGRYGEHGALTAFLREFLCDVSPRGVLIAELKRHVIARFQLATMTRAEHKKLANSIRTVLRRLRDLHGVLECQESWRGRLSQPLWRWKQTAPTLDSLREAADERDPQPDAL